MYLLHARLIIFIDLDAFVIHFAGSSSVGTQEGRIPSMILCVFFADWSYKSREEGVGN